MEFIDRVCNDLNIKSDIVKKVVDMIEEDLTFHFILRYRKEMTGDIDESDLREIFDRVDYVKRLDEKRLKLIDSLEEKNLLTPQISKEIDECSMIKDLELIADRFKEKREKFSQKGIDYGFLPMVTKLIKYGDLPNMGMIERYEDGEKSFNALLSSEISLNLASRSFVKDRYFSHGKIEVKAVDPKNSENRTYQTYIDREFRIKYLQSFQVLAINRGVKGKILKRSLKLDEINRERFLNYYKRVVNYSEKVVKEIYRKIVKSVESEILSEALERAEMESCELFKKNLKALLLTKPVKDKRVLAVDPGYKNGCKFVVLDRDQNPVETGKFYLNRENRLPSRDSFDLIVLGNGTASKESYSYLYKEYGMDIYIVNEAGASVYSGSDIAKEEFPDLDPLDRGTISIGRRFLDSMAELVKIPVHSLGVGMYQHDIKKSLLEKRLTEAIEDVVNFCGVDVNSASPYLLKNISGIGKRSAKKIVNHKPYRSREELKKILSPKAFQLASGFLRVSESDISFDNTTIHPDYYDVASRIESDIRLDNLQQYDHYDIDRFNYDLIIKEINNPGSSQLKRDNEATLIKPIDSDELSIGLRLKGVVRNIVPFGLYVDFGFKNDGLLHRSKLKDGSSIESFSPGETVNVEIIGVEDGKVSLRIC
jgi:uncharacterized protein